MNHAVCLTRLIFFVGPPQRDLARAYMLEQQKSLDFRDEL
jgi:hypothetical protein